MPFLENLIRPKRKTAGEKMPDDRARELGFVGEGAVVIDAIWEYAEPEVTALEPLKDPPVVAPAATPPPASKLLVLLGDLLPRIPTRALKAGLHDPERGIAFTVMELADGIARGRVSVPLSQLARLCPETFETPAHPGEDLSILLPLQKLMAQLAAPAAPPEVASPTVTNGPIPEPVETAVAAGEGVEGVEVVDRVELLAELPVPVPEPVPEAAPSSLEAVSREESFPLPTDALHVAATLPQVRPPEVHAEEEISALAIPVLLPGANPPEPFIPPAGIGLLAAGRGLPPRPTPPTFQPPPLFGKAPPDSVLPPSATELPVVAAKPAKPELVIPRVPFARFDQTKLQALFMTDELLDLPKICRLAAELPGVEGCWMAVGEKVVQRGHWPEELDEPTLRDLERRLAEATRALGGKLPPLQTVTLFAEQRAISFFAGREVSLCVVHSPRGFLPGVREKLAGAALALGEGLGGEAS